MSLQDDIVEVLQEAGPLELEFIRLRLCIASEARARAALFVLEEEGRIEILHCSRDGRAYRVRGDTREVGPGDIWSAWDRKRKKAIA